MKKAIVVLTGIPAGKNKFTQVCKKLSWVWGINPKNHLPKDSENKHELEEKYLLENIERFLSDDADVKTDGIRTYNTFLLVAHGVSGKQTEMLKNDYGVLKLHIVASESDVTLEVLSHNDLVLVESDPLFETRILTIISIIAKG